MFNLNEKYFSISERCGRNHQNKFCLRLPKRRFCTWELNTRKKFKYNTESQIKEYMWVIFYESSFVIFHFRAWLLERNIIIKATKEYNGNKYRHHDLQMRGCLRIRTINWFLLGTLGIKITVKTENERSSRCRRRFKILLEQ